MSDFTVQQRARDAMIARLNVDRDTGVPEAQAGQWFPGDPVRGSEIHVYFHQEDARPVGGFGGDLTQNELLMVVQPVAAAETSAEVDELIEPLRKWIGSRLGDSNLDGLVHSVEYRGTKWERGRSDLVYCAAAMGWMLKFQTARADFTETL